MWAQLYDCRKSRIITIIILLIATACDRARDYGKKSEHRFNYTSETADDMHVFVSYTPGIKPFPLVLFLHGAGCGTLAHIHASSRKYLEGTGAAVTTIDKPGAYYGLKQIALLSLVSNSIIFPFKT